MLKTGDKNSSCETASQNITTTYAYDAFGNLLSSNQAISQPYRYVGQQFYYSEPSLSLQLLGMRWYDATTGRFVSKDPILSVSPYVYVGNSPGNRTDAIGLYTYAAAVYLPILTIPRWWPWHRPRPPKPPDSGGGGGGGQSCCKDSGAKDAAGQAISNLNDLLAEINKDKIIIPGDKITALITAISAAQAAKGACKGAQNAKDTCAQSATDVASGEVNPRLSIYMCCQAIADMFPVSSGITCRLLL